MQKVIDEKTPVKPLFSEAIKFWFILGWISFGGTTGHITIMHDFLVEKKKWVSNSKFYHALNACMVLPGPEAHQLAIYLGWKLHGKKGGIVAGLFFILPSMLILLGLSIIYARYGNTSLLTSIFNGLKPAVLAIILFATWKVGKKALITPFHFFIAALAFVLSYFFKIPMPFIIFGIIGMGILIYLTVPNFLLPKDRLQQKNEERISEDLFYINSNQSNPKISLKKLGMQAIVFIGLWLVPFLVVINFLNDSDFWKSSSLLFTKAAFFTIGGSYTVIPYVANVVTNKVMWLTKTQMIDGFALAETTPGPLVIVLAYIGFMAGFNHFDGSLIMGVIGLLVAGYFTFLPNFILIFMGAPLIERSQDNLLIKSVLSLVTAAVVGVIINLAFYLGEDILFHNHAVSYLNINVLSLIWVVLSLILLYRFKLSMIYLIVLSLLFGLLKYFIGL
ncbi:chromate efflux transporter [Flavobacterium aquidurense]|uniref:Chromate transporter n=2 Tax=Flavobacterium TaxID=237 RepID=A0A7W7IW71_9FLAO|nr:MULTISPECIES: chromate efflux transporter [Flavobacterium]MBB4801711.1 chromate transporter [Flavobacterium nitrogenifigens]MBB6386669.1 chromate transporter [Flavobacterium notoginsengisoli]